MSFQRAHWRDLDAVTAYRILALRSQVFVVEQECAYLDLDGLDLASTTEHWWVPGRAGEVRAYLRVLVDSGGVRRIGRVVTDADARGWGLATRLLLGVLDAYPDSPLVLSAQVHLAEWYAGFGFQTEGDTYLEDDIPHILMRRTLSGA